MRSYTWEGVSTAVSSIVHGGEAAGTIRYLRRERFLTPDGPLDVPVVSGNALRGSLRRISAAMYWETLGRPDLPLPVMHALFGGGALVKAKGEPVTGAKWAKLRAVCPHVGVFGAAGGGRLLPGVLQVGKLIPVVTELAYLGMPGFDQVNVSAWDVTQIEEYSKVVDTPTNPAGHVSTHVDTSAYASTGTSDAGDPTDLRWGVETFLAGTRFTTRFGLRNATETEAAYFQAVLTAWQVDGGRVGGMARVGHGQLRFDPQEGHPANLGDWAHLAGVDPDEAVNVLAWLD